MVKRSVFATGAAAAALAAVALLPARAADTGNAIPQFMQASGVAWEAYRFGFRNHPPGPDDLAYDRTANEWSAPLSGIGPITADPAHPFYNNAVAADLHTNSTYRVADLNNAAGKNLKPWAVEALKKQNALVLDGRNGETRQARCWDVGVPDIHEAPFDWFFIQTPKEVVILQGGANQAVRRIYLNVPHSKNPKPSWYGESVGHYEGGDTLVIDTIGLSDRTFVDGYRTPHTDKVHVIERLKISGNGQVLDASFTVDDPDTFYQPWGAERIRHRMTGHEIPDEPCALNNDDKFDLGFDPVPTAGHPDF